MKRFFAISASLLLLVCCSAPKSDMDRFVDDLMSRMTLDQKIGQLNLHSAPGFISAERVTEDDENTRMLREGMLGGIYGSGNFDLLKRAQEIALESGAGIPLIFGMDVIHGHETVFPIPLAMAASWDIDGIEKAARTAAREASAVGINWVFSPMVDICRDARWGRIAEGAGEDPYLGGEIAKAYVRGYQGTDGVFDTDEVMACVKHYALYGAAEGGRDYNSVFLSRQEAMNGYMIPYREAAKAGAGSYMSSFNEFEGIPATMNKWLMDDVLRGMWGFDGFIVSDATAVLEEVAHGIGDLREVSARSLQAGLDMDMNSDGFVGTFRKSLKEGRIKEADIDRACRRILEAKYKLGLFEDPFRYLDGSRRAERVFTEENRAFARELAGECQVLLKNDGVLPLKPGARVAVVGPLADDASAMMGTWATSSRQSETITVRAGLAERTQTLYAEGSWLFRDKDMEEAVRYGLIKMFRPDFQAPGVHKVPQAALIAEAVAKAMVSDVVVACVGEIAEMNGEGASRSDVGIPYAQAALLRALKATGKPVVLVLFTGRPLVLADEDRDMNAILDVMALGTEGGRAIADVLFGDVNPSGKLTNSYPRSVGQLPLYYNHKNTGRPHGEYDSYKKFVSCYIDEINGPLYPFGYGLSYTSYEYSAPRLSASGMTLKGSVDVTVTVSNTGARDGDETVQLYIHDVYSTSTRPVKELRAFRKVHIPAGQSVDVTFTLTADDLKYYDHELDYVCEPGDFEIMTGPDSRDLQSVLLTVE